MVHALCQSGPAAVLVVGVLVLGLVHTAMVRIERMRPPKPVRANKKRSASPKQSRSSSTTRVRSG